MEFKSSIYNSFSHFFPKDSINSSERLIEFKNTIKYSRKRNDLDNQQYKRRSSKESDGGVP